MTTHAKISYLKSAIRMAGCVIGAAFSGSGLWLAFLILFAAEIIGIVEEFGE